MITELSPQTQIGPKHHTFVRLELSLTGRTPEVRVAGENGEILKTIPVTTVEPGIAAIISANHIEALDILEHVVDEETWLADLAAALEPGGSLVARVPAEGPMAWLDAPNLYRYLVDITARGTSPRETRPTCWHRHYRSADLVELIRGCGLEPEQPMRGGGWLREISHLSNMVRDNYVGKDKAAEQRLVAARPAQPLQLGNRFVGSRLTIVGHKV